MGFFLRSMKLTAECIPRCQCMTLRGSQCSRPAVIVGGRVRNFCRTHAKCPTSRDADKRNAAQQVIAKRFKSKAKKRHEQRVMTAYQSLGAEVLRDLAALRRKSRSKSRSKSPRSHKTPKAKSRSKSPRSHKTPKAKSRSKSPRARKTPKPKSRVRTPGSYARPTKASLSRSKQR